MLELVGVELVEQSSGVSQNSVSRRSIAATAERLEQFRSRSLEHERWLIVFVDGFDFAGHTMIGALGVSADGSKVPLGVGAVPGLEGQNRAMGVLVSGFTIRGRRTH